MPRRSGRAALQDRDVAQRPDEESAVQHDLGRPVVGDPAVFGRAVEDPQQLEVLDAGPLHQGAEVVQARGQVVLARGIVGVVRREPFPDGDRLLLGARVSAIR